MLTKSAPVCDRDCFHCPFEDCIDDSMVHEDYAAAAALEREVLFSKTAKQKKIAARQKAYYEANREKIAAGQKAYYEANREKWNAYLREYRRRRRELLDVSHGDQAGAI